MSSQKEQTDENPYFLRTSSTAELCRIVLAQLQVIWSCQVPHAFCLINGAESISRISPRKICQQRLKACPCRAHRKQVHSSFLFGEEILLIIRHSQVWKKATLWYPLPPHERLLREMSSENLFTNKLHTVRWRSACCALGGSGRNLCRNNVLNPWNNHETAPLLGLSD